MSADSPDAHAWELSKENILPTRRGRKMENINKDIEASKSTVLGEADPTRRLLQVQMETWKDQLSMQETEGEEDPLKLWVRFIRWHEQAFTRGSDLDARNRVLEDCIEKLIDVPRYQDCPRFFKHVITRYSDLNQDHALSLFSFFEHRRFFQTVAQFYSKWAIAAEFAEQYDEAARIYQLGIDRHAEPADLLPEKLEHFQLRTVNAVVAASKYVECLVACMQCNMVCACAQR